jgi:hypothetical protein
MKNKTAFNIIYATLDLRRLNEGNSPDMGFVLADRKEAINPKIS